MTGEELKQSVLNYSIQGKIVDQRKEEGNAENLFKEILLEQEKLITNGKIKKSKSLPEIKDEEIPFNIPRSWKWIRLGDIAYLTNPVTVKNVHLPYLEAKYLRGKIKPKIKTAGRYVSKNDYVILVDGENSGEVFNTQEGGILGSTFKKLIINNVLNHKYVLNYLDFYRSYFRERKTGAAIPHLNKKMFRNMLFPLPPFQEQKRIVAKIENIAYLIDEYNQKYQELKRLNIEFSSKINDSILKYAIQGKLVEQRQEEGNAEDIYKEILLSKEKLINEGKIKKSKSLPEITDDEIPYNIPSSWKWVKHNDLFEVIGGSQPPKSEFRFNSDKGYVRLFQIRDYGSNPSPTYVPINRVTKFTKKGDILLARYGASIGKVFRAEDGAYNVALAKVKPLFTSKLINFDYLYIYYCSYLYQNLVRSISRSGQAGFNKDDLNKLLFPLPPLQEQKRIVAKIEELKRKINSLEKSIISFYS